MLRSGDLPLVAVNENADRNDGDKRRFAQMGKPPTNFMSRHTVRAALRHVRDTRVIYIKMRLYIFEKKYGIIAGSRALETWKL